MQGHGFKLRRILLLKLSEKEYKQHSERGFGEA
jgi:hypothetical protein